VSPRPLGSSSAGHDDAAELLPGLYTMTEAAQLKGVSYHTVSRAVREGRLPAQRLGRMALIAATDLAAWEPMRERAPKKYRTREPDATVTPTVLGLRTDDDQDA